ncbi:phosphorylated adapter RNA export protein-like [Varroa jacobsoni]|uniref:Phosphorylated adapter RNA export protein n=1 Tax=Varroa destructor TaxID=109461 RepID=A0A7M7J727_VARDE|nr:phosphorylated adapter RNA export protein-like [Varroa destructor]XP_022647754.1 phosphorylated adapter RNA export protein-like [Varroa destructor]XP_022706408.1 phosphorylated adapter RNA export protein-like [Varroa jacobsoni]XP_022706409.1 phosphorylated adapter RNA export protein-like [Varroa jacobsoni]
MYRTKAVDSGTETDSSDNEGDNWKRSSNRYPPNIEDLPSSISAEHVRWRSKSDTGAALKRGARRANHIWGNVIQEQALMENMGSGFTVEGLPDERENRGVESYDFTRARLDQRPQVEPIRIEGIPKELEKIRQEESARAHRVRKRLGIPGAIKEISPASSTDEVVQALCKRLDEPKIGLIERVVNIIGSKKSLELLYATENIEANGGLMVNNGTRRRTAGGVFLHLVRSDGQITSDEINNIFAPDREEYKEVQRKRKRSEVEKKAYRTIRRLEESILGEAQSSSSVSTDDDDDNQYGRPKRVRPITMDEDCIAEGTPQKNDSDNKGDPTSDLEEGEIDDD